MKSLRYVTIIGISTIVLPFLGIPAGWKQVIFVAMGLGLLTIVVFLKKAILTYPHKEDVDIAGASFQDSEFVHDVDIDAEQEEVKEVEPNPTVSVKEVIKSESFQFPKTDDQSKNNKNEG